MEGRHLWSFQSFSSEPINQDLPLIHPLRHSGKREHPDTSGHLSDNTLVIECGDPHSIEEKTELKEATTCSKSLH